MARCRLSSAVHAGPIEILVRTQVHFADSARKGFEAMVVTALRDIARQPDRAGTVEQSAPGGGD